ncbi:MAG TPA: Gmad2 immunoglobulin-like domain-containing protein [Candidatus Gracilibacteria bacterium]|nr:Gmad2 immunoglobulin-like domain-containing protein [Candidatus Gracilibacteria bacterium]
MKKAIIGLILVATLAGCQTTPESTSNQVQTKPENENTQKVASIKIDNVTPHQVVSSPLDIKGEVRGNWMFEAVFDIELQTADGQEIAKAPAYATDNWMTTDFVPFESTITFDPPEATEGKLIFIQSSPAGEDGPEPEFFEMPVRFSEQQ